MAFKSEYSRRADINMKFSEFEMPPMQDVLIVGRRAPIGPEAARRMVNILSPDQYIIEKIEDSKIEALVIKSSLLKMLPREQLVTIILEEGGKLADEKSIIKAEINITLQVSKLIEV